jgi:hypothetical protein
MDERDDLQSVLRVLRLGGVGDDLQYALTAVDAVANERASLLCNLLPNLDDDPDRERWRAVAWREPAAWWSGAS